MARNTSISLGPHFDEFIAERVSDARYGSASEVVPAGLPPLKNTEIKPGAFRAMLVEGEKNGFSDYSYEKLIKQLDNDTG